MLMRTKGQLSIEFMIYVAMATASLVVSLRLFTIGTAAQGVSIGNAYSEELAAAIDANMGYSSSAFSAYVPRSICNATIGDGYIRIGGSLLELDSNLTMADGSVCRNSGGVERLLLYRVSNDTFELSGSVP
ncbi:MAG: hypothetical protein KGH66_01220 [Candidatus Micrarchaeota archaeon]|nr:hypothetical protein [Candidatus Micrarchaeota archaeon]